MRKLIMFALLAMILATIVPSVAQSSNGSIINLIINFKSPLTESNEDVNQADTYIGNIYTEINSRSLVGTVFSTQDVIRKGLGLELTRIGYESSFELGISGNHSDENISVLSYANQKDELEKSKKWVEASKVCGQNEIKVSGFMPQSFEQNGDTYRALDEIGILYDAGFQAGLLYMPGHETDVWPYLVKGHKFYAVPISTHSLLDKKFVLQDSYFQNKGLDSSQWYDALVGKFEEIQNKDEPLVIGLTTSVSGSGEYLDALSKFLDYAISKNAKFVTTEQLVTLAKTGVHDVSSLPKQASNKCATCDQDSSLSMNASILGAAEADNASQTES
jgi:hypothetical protein